jgi:CubicO group peptidase (beta-lactamase class C family)
MMSAAARAQNPAIDRLFVDFDKPNVPGCAVAVVQDGKTIYSKSFGRANLEYDAPVRMDTPFHVASVSKQFTAFAILLLQRERKLGLDDDIRKYLPEMHNFGPKITIRHLLHHISGLRDQWDLCVLSGRRMEDVITQDDILNLVFRQRELNFEPGSAYVYCNTGFTLLSEIVKRVSGMPYSKFCEERIFKPLGMTRTKVHEDAAALIPGRAYSYEAVPLRGWQTSILSYSNWGATSLFTTVDDFIKWDRNFDDAKVGGRAVIDWMTEPGVLNNGQKTTYANGLIVFKYRRLNAVEHAGGDAGFRSEYLRFPDQHLSIIIFSNRAEAQPWMQARAIADLLLEAKFPQPKPGPATPAQTVEIANTELDRCVGDYQFSNGALATIRRDGSRLVGRINGTQPVILIPTSPTQFTVDAVQAKVEFVIKGNEAATELILIQGGINQVAKRTALNWPTGDGLAIYAGRYTSSELDTTYEISLRGGSLFLRHPRGELKLEMTLPDRFECDFGSITFDRGAGRRIVGFRISTGRTMNLRFDRRN